MNNKGSNNLTQQRLGICRKSFNNPPPDTRYHEYYFRRSGINLPVIERYYLTPQPPYLLRTCFKFKLLLFYCIVLLISWRLQEITQRIVHAC